MPEFVKQRLPIFKMTVRGQSMTPFVVDGQSVAINKLAFKIKNPRVGDVVLVQHPHRNIMLLKRITHIQNNTYFVTGDNPAHSTDSRSFGYIDKKYIIGKVIVL